MMLKTVTFLLTVLVSGSRQQCFSSNDTAAVVSTDSAIGWANSRYDFSTSLFKHLNKAYNQSNVIFSPSSVYDLLLLAYFGADHETEKSIAKVLELYDIYEKAQTWRIYRTRRLLTSEEDAKTYPLKTASKLFFSNKLNLRSCVKENLKKEIEMIDYETNSKWATNYINKWVEDNTDGEIKNFFKELSPYSKLTMVNAVMFKGTWQNAFEPSSTRNLPFHVNSKITKTTSMMMKTAVFFVGHIDFIKARVLKIPYNGGRQIMVIILPDNDLDTTIEKMGYYSITQIRENRAIGKLYLQVMIPKFNESMEILLNDPLEKLGIGNAITNYADYSRFTGKKEVSFNVVKQKAMIQVDEEGTKAVAVTGGGLEQISLLLPQDKFICDRPFAYYIYDYLTDNILFMGTFRQPK